MLSGSRNGKSVKVYSRIPHELANAIAECAGTSESLSSFIVAALRAEVARRKQNDDPAEKTVWGL